MATGLKTRPILMKGPSARVIPPRLTTKSSTDLLPLEMRLGTSKDAQPAAILKQKQVQKLDIPAQTRRKSSADVDEQKGVLKPDQTSQTTESLLYVQCQLNGEQAIALIDTGSLQSTIPRGIAEVYGLIGSGGKAINCHGNGTKHNICPEIETDEYRIVTELRLGRAPSDYSLIVVPDTSSLVLTIGMDVLHRNKCVLDFESRVLYLNGVSGDVKELLLHEEVYGDTRLVRSQSSTL
ncbi:uncharacterized protein LOC117305020 [Asterias rubens]|uniref:uncharacterized protein LOC117305020 n=1 Tax=Asterias rubens TaxID=7604 RepID=UPI001454EBB0|nr:uncharacterized protein LOC117305020 [Asterias rubens]XP_033645600.1 uncharacterized protein LOC117305020 [Asterias rubens]XP_033645601.1 uncharacterized protein LOC117305020 [Asterias rubens]